MILKLRIILMFFNWLMLSEAQILEDNRNDRMLKISDGSIVDISEYPFVVSIWCENYKIGGRMAKMEKYFCSGALITMQHVLTTADCIFNFVLNYTRVRAGSSDRLLEGTVSNVKDIYVHSEFKRKFRNFNDNLAIILLEKPLNQSLKINKIPLANENVIITEGTVVKIADWGKANAKNDSARMLQKTSLSVMSSQKCKNLTEFAVKYDVIPLDTVLCADSANSNRDIICYSNYGGPMVYNGTLVGVNSIGYQCKKDEFIGGVFMKISHYRKWIDSIIDA